VHCKAYASGGGAGRLGDRHGHRSGILLGAVAQTVTVCVVLFWHLWRVKDPRQIELRR